MKYYILFIFLILLFSCKKELKNVSQASYGHYVAHLQLDSTYLKITEVADSIDTPWDIAPGPDGYVWYSELLGTVSLLNLQTGRKKEVLKLSDVFYKKSHGLLGFTPHPEFNEYPYVYLHYTFRISLDETREEVKSRIVRYTFTNDTLTKPFILLDSIVGKTYHNGSRLVISPDEKLFFSMGDAGDPDLSQTIIILTEKF